MPHRTETKNEVTGMVWSAALQDFCRLLAQHILLKSPLTYANKPKQLVSEGYRIRAHVRFNTVFGRLLLLSDRKMQDEIFQLQKVDEERGTELYSFHVQFLVLFPQSQ